MPDITVGSFKAFDINKNRNYSANEVTANNAAFTKAFLGASRTVQLDILKKMSPEAKNQLFESLKEHYTSAGDPASKKNSEHALIVTGANITNSMSGNNFRELAINIIRFMGNNLEYTGTADEKAKKTGTRPPNGRDACEYSVGEIIAEENYNGCAEAAKTYQALFNEAASQRGSSARGEYISAFDVDCATPEYISNNKGQPGHAVVEVRLGSDTFLIDPSRCDDGIFKNGERPSFKELEGRMVINHHDVNDEYTIPTDNGEKKLHIFNRGTIFNSEADATAATKLAASQHYLKRK